MSRKENYQTLLQGVLNNIISDAIIRPMPRKVQGTYNVIMSLFPVKT